MKRQNPSERLLDEIKGWCEEIAYRPEKQCLYIQKTGSVRAHGRWPKCTSAS